MELDVLTGKGENEVIEYIGSICGMPFTSMPCILL